MNHPALLAYLFISLFVLNVQAEKKPNIVIIIADDLGYGDIEGFGFNEVKTATPALTKMATEGAKLTHFLVTAPYCAPSRSSILTGRYPFRTKIVYNPSPDQGINHGMSQDEVTFGEILKSVGYDTYYVGKWHLGHERQYLPTTQGFDEYFGILYSNDMRPVQIIENEKVAEYPVIQSTLTEKYTKKSIEFMKRSVQKEKPFLLVLSHAMPHRPLAVSDKFYTPETPDDLYQDVIRELDYNIGIFMQSLKDLKIDDNTMVIFISDNGANHGGDNGGLRGRKSTTFDGGLRVPFIARYPGVIPAGTINNSIASGVDFLPTFAKLAGAKLPEDRVIDGKDLSPQMTSSTATSQHEYVIGMKSKNICTVHTDKWKLHAFLPEFYKTSTELNSKSRINRSPDGSTIIAPFEQPNSSQFPGLKTGDQSRNRMLFNVATDPGEQKDLSQEFPEEFKRLEKYYDEIRKQVPQDLFVPTSKEFIHNQGGQLDFWNIKN